MCRTWGLRVTDLNQGIVYGLTTPETKIDERLRTSFHYDDIFGTVINRFMTQGLKEIPLTIYVVAKKKSSSNIMIPKVC